MRTVRIRSGFTLIEIMVVVLILGILLAIAVPNFVRARAATRLKTIIANLKQIDSAAQQWGLEQNMLPVGPVAQSNLDGSGGTTAYIHWPSGPITGTYSVVNVGTNATFDGGNLGAMDCMAWQSTCSSDPGTCGL